jgi:hypothetical protein
MRAVHRWKLTSLCIELVAHDDHARQTHYLRHGAIERPPMADLSPRHRSLR